MTMGRNLSFWADISGQAAAELAMVLPILIPLVFGTAELGYYFHQEHVVVDAVRDGARFAGRQPLADMSCAGVDSDTEASIQTATRLISPNAADTAENRRIANWESNDSVTVTVSCAENEGFLGLYSNMDDLPRVRVDADVAYQSLFSQLGFGNLVINVQASSEAVVIGA